MKTLGKSRNAQSTGKTKTKEWADRQVGSTLNRQLDHHIQANRIRNAPAGISL